MGLDCNDRAACTTLLITEKLPLPTLAIQRDIMIEFIEIEQKCM